MRKITILLLILMATPLRAADTPAKEAENKDVSAAKVTIKMNVQPNEARNYNVSVELKGKTVSESSSEPIDLEATYTLKMQHKYGIREGDGLLPLDVVSSDAKATLDGQQFAMPSGEFPRYTLLIDNAWKVHSAFGISRTRYAQQSPGLNYANLILVYLIPDIDKEHALGESWQSRIKLPGFADECSVTTVYKSVEDKKGVKIVNVHQDYVWTEQKLPDGVLVNSKTSVDSALAIDGGRLINAHAQSDIVFKNPASADKGSEEVKAKMTIDVSQAK